MCFRFKSYKNITFDNFVNDLHCSVIYKLIHAAFSRYIKVVNYVNNLPDHPRLYVIFFLLRD